MQSNVVNIYKEGVSREQVDTFKDIIADGKIRLQYTGEYNSLLDYVSLVVNASPMGTACLDVLKSFIAGEGIANKKYDNVKLNNQGESFTKLHRNLAGDLAYSNRFCVLITWEYNFEKSTLKPTQFEHLPIEWVRYSQPNKNGEVFTIKYNPYYNKAEEFNNQKEYFIYENIKLSKKRFMECIKNGEPLKEVYFYCEGNEINRVYTYPKYFLAGEDAFLADASAWTFHKNNIAKNFFLGGILQVQGRPEMEVTDKDGNTKTNRQLLEESLSKMFSGSSNAGSILALWKNNEDESEVKYEPLQSNDNDTKLISVMELCRQTIPTIMGVSPLLAGVEIAGKLGDSKEKEGAIKFQNEKTQVFREALTNFYTEFMPMYFRGTKREDFEVQKIQEQLQIPDFIWNALTVEQKQEYIRKNYPNLITTI